MPNYGIISGEGSVEILYGTGTKKMLNLMILKILEKYSDADHCLTQKRIIELLDIEYGMQCDRKSVATNINSLKEMGYDIVKEREGVYLIREFEDWELRVLIDSVLFSQTISRTRAKQLIEKLKTLGNKYFSAKVKHIVNLPELHRSDNTSVALTLDALNDAVSQNKKISFTYNSYDEDLKLHPRRAEPYVVSPYQMVATNGRYYLIANNEKYDDFTHYRVDKMTDVKILGEPARPVKEFAPNGLNLPRHMAEHIYMFSGESVRVKFWTYGYMLDALVDWFGKDFDIIQRTGDRILISVRVNLQAMKYWLMQFGEHIEVIEPQALRDEIRNIAENIRSAHVNPTGIEAETFDAEIPDWIRGTNFDEVQPKFIVAGAGNFGAMVVDTLKARSAEELEFVDEVDFIALNAEDLQLSCSEPVYVGGMKFTAWSFDPKIQRRLDEAELIVIVTDEQNLDSAIAFTAGSSKTKIFLTPDTERESAKGNIFVKLDAEHFAENVYRAIHSFRDLLYCHGGEDFASIDAGFLRSSAGEFAIAFYDDNVLELGSLEGAAKVLCVATEASEGVFEEIIVQAAFPNAEIRMSVIVDNSLETGAVQAMIVAVK